ncbi:site-specific integrase [Rudanella paleaurantiibacter]|nr:site-specific integrase [Rudanella paleaurantiibacter]
MEKLFWAHASKKNPDYITLYFRITLDGSRAELGSTGIKIHHKHWNAEAQRVTARSAEAQQYNHTLDIWREKAQAIYNELLLKKVPFTANNIKTLFRQQGRGFTFLYCFELYLKQLSRDPDITFGTWKTYDVVRKKIEAYLKETNQLELPIENFTKGILEKYRTWMRIDQQRAPNTIRKHTATIKQVHTWAYLNDYSMKDCLQGYRVPSVKAGTPISLNTEELLTLLTHDFSNFPVLGEVRDQFLISCFSGLAYADLKTLRSEHLVIRSVQTHEDEVPSNLTWLLKDRIKTDITARQPLHPVVRMILDKYEGRPEEMHVRPNQKTNLYLKLIAMHCGINKPLTTHVGRKTFANLCLNGGLYSDAFAVVCPAVGQFKNTKFSTESTIAMMGRTSAKGLEVYATPGEQSIMLELKTRQA